MYANHILYILLSLCFTAFFIHGYLPESLTQAMIVPIIKDRSKDITSTDNYRPVAIVTAISKIFELCILSRIENVLESNDFQFGFKAKHSTDMSIFVIKEIVNFYKRHNSPFFSASWMQPKRLTSLIIGLY